MKKLIAVLALVVSAQLTATAQGSIWGTTQSGGTNGDGTLFRINTDGTHHSVYKSFFTKYTGINPASRPIQASNGKLYGVTQNGGSKMGGVLYEYDLSTGSYSSRFEFDLDGTTGSGPVANPIQSSNGKLYGTTVLGPTSTDGGVIYEYDLTTSTYTIRYTFNAVTPTNGAYPVAAMTQAPNGKLYGVASGGTNFGGVLFEFDPAGGYTKKQDFYTAFGWQIVSGELVLAPNGKLYGTASEVSTGQGLLFEYDISANTLTRKTGSTNQFSNQAAITISSAGKVYGINSTGIAEYDLNTSTFTQKYTFGTAANDGSSHQGLILNGTSLYGLAYAGGNNINLPSYNGDGILFQFNLATSTFLKRYSFGGGSVNPKGTLLLANDGMLYGTTFSNAGILFQFNPGSSALVIKQQFAQSTTGKTPTNTVVKGTNNVLYGMTSVGGGQNTGMNYQVDPLADPGTPNGSISSISFDRKIAQAGLGAYPEGSLVQASNNRLYGFTSKGSTNGYGTIFEVLPGTDMFTGNTWTPKAAFTFDHAVTGSQNEFVAHSNGKLYAMTSKGGANNNGTIIEYTPGGSSYTVKFDFASASSGNSPLGGLAAASNGKLYGMTSLGGANNLGTLFEYDPSTSTFTKKFDFNGATNGSGPNAGLIQASNGKLYGMTAAGGSSGYGTLFQFDISTNTLTTLLHFNSTTNGATPNSSLVISPNGKLYGTTSQGGANNLGVIFEFDPSTNTYTKKLDFNGTNGSSPSGRLYYDGLPKAVQTVSINPIPAKLVTDPTFAVTASASSGLGLTYNSSIPTVATIDASGNITIVGYGQTSITASQAGDANYYPASAQTLLTVNRLTQTITFNTLPTGCVAGTYNLTSTTTSAGLTVSFTSQNVNVASINSNQVYAITSGTVVITASNNGNGTYGPVSVSQVFSISPVPTISAGGSTTCITGNVTLTASTGTAYQWSTGATTQNISAGAGSYTVTVDGCTSASKVVTAAPTASISALGATTFCAGGSVVLQASSGTGYSYAWSPSGGNGQSMTATSSGTYTCNVTLGGCQVTSNAITVTVNPNPSGSISGATTGCDGVSLYAPGGYWYLWNTGSTASSIWATTTGGYNVKLTDPGTGCFTNLPNYNITIEASFTASISKSGTVCTGVTLTASPSGKSYYWPATGETTQSIVVWSAGNYTVNVNGTYCSSSATINVPTKNCGPCTRCRIAADGTLEEDDSPAIAEFEVYPNPVDKELVIELPKPAIARTGVTLVDQLGKTLHQSYIEQGESKKTLVMEHVQNGFYVLTVTDNAQTNIAKKVIVRHQK